MLAANLIDKIAIAVIHGQRLQPANSNRHRKLAGSGWAATDEHDNHDIHDRNSRHAARARTVQDAAQIVSDHQTAALVPGLVEALQLLGHGSYGCWCNEDNPNLCGHPECRYQNCQYAPDKAYGCVSSHKRHPRHCAGEWGEECKGTIMDDLTLSKEANDNTLAWHSDHPAFWRWFGYYWLRIRLWIWDHGGRKLYWSTGRRPPVKKWWIRWCYPGHYDPCESCGYSWEWGSFEGWFQCEKTGTSFDGEHTFHWFEGTQTCPRCRMTWYYSDSD